MEKLIIETNIPIAEALEYVKLVIAQGKISKTSKGRQYCFASFFGADITVYADKNKHSDKLTVLKRI